MVPGGSVLTPELLRLTKFVDAGDLLHCLVPEDKTALHSGASSGSGAGAGAGAGAAGSEVAESGSALPAVDVTHRTFVGFNTLKSDVTLNPQLNFTSGEKQEVPTNPQLLWDAVNDVTWILAGRPDGDNGVRILRFEVQSAEGDAAADRTQLRGKQLLGSPAFALPAGKDASVAPHRLFWATLASLDAILTEMQEDRLTDGCLTIAQRQGDAAGSGKSRRRRHISSPDDCESACRFKGTQQGWGLGNGSMDCISFKVDTDITLVGVGMYGGSTRFVGKSQIHEGMNATGELVAEVSCEIDPKMDPSITPFFFDEPVELEAGKQYHWNVRWDMASNGWYGNDGGGFGFDGGGKKVETDAGPVFDFLQSGNVSLNFLRLPSVPHQAHC